MPEEIKDPYVSLYERMAKLIETDPAAYYAERNRLITAAISDCPQHLRPSLQRMQNEVDFLRAEKQNPANSCAAIFWMIGERLSVISAKFSEVQTIAEEMQKTARAMRDES